MGEKGTSMASNADKLTSLSETGQRTLCSIASSQYGATVLLMNQSQ
jgi:hypothetical protein